MLAFAWGHHFKLHIYAFDIACLLSCHIILHVILIKFAQHKNLLKLCKNVS